MSDEKHKEMPQDERWFLYTIEKSKIQHTGLSPKEYEQEIIKICDRLGI